MIELEKLVHEEEDVLKMKHEKPSIHKEVVSQILSDKPICTLFITDDSDDLIFIKGDLVFKESGSVVGDFTHISGHKLSRVLLVH